MALDFSVLSSGSKANASLVVTGETRLLIDCGLSAKQIVMRLESLGHSLSDIDAILLTHEHSDHVRGLPVLMKQAGLLRRAACPGSKKPTLSKKDAVSPEHAGIQIFCSRPSWENSEILRSLGELTYFEPETAFSVGDVQVKPLLISHDAAQPVAFRLESGGKCLCFLTDLGTYSDEVFEWASGLDGLVVESNHDLELLATSPYSEYLKNRISSQTGHLSNNDAASLVEQIVVNGEQPKVIVAGHISENSNKPELAVECLRSGWLAGAARVGRLSSGPEPEIVAASVAEPTKVFSL